MKTAAALVIGNELLSGKIADQNLVVLARTLRAAGVLLRRANTILDELDVIAAEVRVLASTHDWLFTSGGVGPTHDDVTIEGVARAFDVPVVTSPILADLLRSHYGERLTEGHLLMARIPEGARLVSGESLVWPVVVMQNVWVLPGVPEIFQAKQPFIRAELTGGTPFVSFAVLTTLDEGQLKPMLDRVVDEHRDVAIGSYPRWSDPEYRTRLTFDGILEDQVRAARDAFAQSLPAGTIVRLE
ncbi:competence/damage-inducible protein A [Chondromyces apiculatus]|uniref:Molybdopterin binding motif protein n=1 Tax=Chondromyces apiculatus DSM 436 TaxID=1192034 RepID=A0A017SZI5_9BACT|nr:molybdopterin-binding protein [Chondromyces apiculatus]EYF02000.1 Molybdopterin binding motif protein [Chondromyces apiculatus DSM 436]